MWGSTLRVWRTSNPEYRNKQCTPEVHPRGFTWVFTLIDTLSKQKRMIHHVIRKPCEILFKRFSTHLMELNNYPPLSLSDQAPPLICTLKHLMIFSYTPSWTAGQEKANLQGWEDEMSSYKATCNIFKRMEVAEKVYGDGTTSKTPIREDSNRASHVSKWQGGEVASPTNPKKGCSDKRKTRNASNPSNKTTWGKNSCCMNPENLQKRAKYSRNTPPGTLRSGHTINNKPAPTVT